MDGVLFCGQSGNDSFDGTAVDPWEQPKDSVLDGVVRGDFAPLNVTLCKIPCHLLALSHYRQQEMSRSTCAEHVAQDPHRVFVRTSIADHPNMATANGIHGTVPGTAIDDRLSVGKDGGRQIQ